MLWDMIPLVDDAAVEAVQARGEVRAIAISHPHYYSGMVEWSEALGGVPILLHEADREWIMRPDPAIELWSGDVKELFGGLTLLRLGGHYPGGTVLHDRERRTLLSGDILQVIPDRRFVSFMWSYPNLIPLPGARGAPDRRRARGVSVRADPRRLVGPARPARRQRGRPPLGGALRGRAGEVTVCYLARRTRGLWPSAAYASAFSDSFRFRSSRAISWKPSPSSA